MPKKRIEDLVGGEVLASPVMTWDYQMILPTGAVIKKEYIPKLKDLEIAEVSVKADEVHESELVILKSDIEDAVKDKVKDILERHTYHHNEELAELSRTADNIITNILEEEQVVERIFDIRERSTDIYEHSISTCSMAILTSLKLNVPKSRIHDIGVGCLLHDIGLRYTSVDFTKLNVAQLVGQELIEYKKHPVYGYSNLRDETWISNFTKNIILYHHERLNGSGFPLRTREIPLECRIVNVCDVFDEMICGITCKKVKVYEAVEYLKGYSGILFDKEVVDVFLSFVAVYPAGTHVITNEGEEAVVVGQNKDFQDRPIIRIIKDKNGNPVQGEIIRDMVRIHNIFIDKVLE